MQSNSQPKAASDSGSTFWFTLPYKEASNIIEKAPQKEIQTIEIEKDKLIILVAEDNESDYKRFQAQVKVDFMFRLAKNFYIGPMAVFDYIDGRNFEKPELWEGMAARTTNTSLGLSLLYDSRDFLTNASHGYYLRIDQRFSPAFLGNKYAFSSTELTTSYISRYGKVECWQGNSTHCLPMATTLGD